MEESLPTCVSEWKDQVHIMGIKENSIHDVEPKSASKFEYSHYLLLRVAWKAMGRSAFKASDFDLDLNAAKQLLASNTDWLDYCANVGPRRKDPLPGVGKFTLPLHYQWEINDLNLDAEPEARAVISPIANRTRSKLPLRSQLEGLHLETPSKSTGLHRKMPLFGSPKQDTKEGDGKNKEKEKGDVKGGEKAGGQEKVESDIDEDDEGEESFISVESTKTPISPEAAKILYPPAGDEEIVNFALFDFANALVLHHRSLQHKWALNRILLTAKFKNSAFQARTDGYLKDCRSDKIRVIVEVKPYVRSVHTQIQEAAEIVALILNKDQPAAQRLLVVSQDRHQIFLTFAEYDQRYLAYLKGTAHADETSPSFLTMREFGPWNIYNSQQIAQIGEILVAVAMNKW